MNEDLVELRLPQAAVSRLEVDRKPRAAATSKLRELLQRAVATPTIRTIWVYGSYARGASSVGDIDLLIEVDDPRDRAQAAWDGYEAHVRGRNPDNDILKSLGASGSSMVEASVSRNHDPALGEPLPVEDWNLLPPADRQHLAPATPPAVQHTGTGELFNADEMRLLYRRGDDVARAHERLESIHEDPAAARCPRTTGIPLLDQLASRIGGANQAVLERYLRASAINVATYVTKPPAPDGLPAAIEAALNERFGVQARSTQGLSHRHQMLRAVLAALQQAGIDLALVWAFGKPADGTTAGNATRVFVDSGQMTLHRLGDYLSSDERCFWPQFDHVVLVLDPQRKAPWIVLDFTAKDQRVLHQMVADERAELQAIFRRRGAEWPAIDVE